MDADVFRAERAARRERAERAAQLPHVVTDDPRVGWEGGPLVYCSCGWIKAHPRRKVRDAAAARHRAKAGA